MGLAALLIVVGLVVAFLIDRTLGIVIAVAGLILLLLTYEGGNVGVVLPWLALWRLRHSILRT